MNKLISIFLVFFTSCSLATDTLDCNSESHHMSVVSGTNDFFSEVMHTLKISNVRNILEKDKLSKAELNWNEKILLIDNKKLLVYVNSNHSYIIYNGVKEELVCDWQK